MGKVTCIYLVVAGMLCFLQGQIFEIKKEIINGNLMFTWTNISTRRNHVRITKDGYTSGWIQITGNTYTVKDAWRYQSVAIRVREYKTADFISFEDHTTTFYGIPSAPMNFTGYSYSSGYVNLTWISDFNGGPEQFFILSRKAESGWIEVANITYPGEGAVGYYESGLLSPGREYWYRLESCNRINCSSRPAEVKVTVLECKTGYFLSGKNPDLHYRNNSDCWPCGNCSDNLPCNTTTGHCSEGCHIDYQAPYCTELITPDQSSTASTSTIILAIICTVILVTIAIIAGVAFRRRLKRRLESTPSQSENEANTPMDAT